ncbi:MAG: DNA polymerase III subunit alpha [Luteitalea sp.]|nr:DNA polymerase III subunit alpha [Luteitalea sp.]
MPSSYIELHVASAFSFLQGASLPEAIVERAAELGYSSIALLDRDGVYGAPRFHKAALRAGLRPIIGAELTISVTGGVGGAGPRLPFVLPVLCESAAGYRNLCQLITRMKMRAPKGEGALSFEDLDGRTDGLVVLAGRPALETHRFGVGGLLDRLVGLFGRDRTFVEIQRHFRRDEEAGNQLLMQMAEAFRVPVLVTNGARFATPRQRPLFDVLTCMHHHTDLAHAGRRLAPNAERYLKGPDEIAALFPDRPGAVARTGELADRLQYTMADLGYRFPDYPVPPGETQSSFLRRLTEVGAGDRYRPYSGRARVQIARELDLIEKLNLAGYFLIVWDLVNFCRQHDILVQGRGSAANSAVCYSLGITAVDPIGMDLLFERFLSEERGEWPDIDLDLPSGDRREQVIQHVYEKYGRLGAAMTANVVTYRSKSAAREVGKALGFDPAQVDRLAKVMNNFEFIDSSDSLPGHLSSVGLDLDSDRVRLFSRLWHEIQDLPRHLGQHSGGMVICQGQLDSVVPLENASMPGRVVVQWDKDDCADMGIVKVDLLGLGMMAVIQDALALVNGESTTAIAGTAAPSCETPFSASPVGPVVKPVDLAHLPQDDAAVYRMFCAADTIGVFQVESRAQMATLPRLKPATFYDIVVQVAIIRPGPIVGQMVHPYLNRRAGREPVTYPHPSLEPILARTLGVPLFQEQLLRIAMVAAGFSGGQAEELRRAFGFKRSERRMKEIEVQLRDGMTRQGITGAPAEQIITSISSFALYGFPESHAASFALLAYASAYLKVHYPAAFYTALLNNQPMGFYHPSTLVKDAQRRGVRFQPIDAQVSDWDCTVERDGAIRLGLRYVAGLREQVGRAICRSGAAGADLIRSAQHLRTPGRQTIASAQPPEAAPHPGSAHTSGSRADLIRSASHMICPKCGCDDPSMLERAEAGSRTPETWFCNNCSHDWQPAPHRRRRFTSIDDLVSRTALGRDELVALADIGALNSFGYERRSALWQAERAVRPSGELFAREEETTEPSFENPIAVSSVSSVAENRPLTPMTEAERLVADYAGTGLTIGRHPMALKRETLAMQGVMRAIDLPVVRQRRLVRVAGMVITRQRPGTAKGFVFLTLEDETGIVNVIIRPDLFARDRLVIIEEPFLLIDGVLQNQDGVMSVRAEAVQGMKGVSVDFDAHDFH